MAPFFALKYAPPAMTKTTPKGNYANAAPKEMAYGSIVVVSSVASTYGGCWGPCFTMSSHAALGVVKAGVATLKGEPRLKIIVSDKDHSYRYRYWSPDQLHLARTD